MSPDNWYSNPSVVRLIDASKGLVMAFPDLGYLLASAPDEVRGLSLFLGDTAEFVVGIKRFGDDGAPEVMWSSGSSPLEALINLDKGVRAGKWREDKPKPSPKPRVKKT